MRIKSSSIVQGPFLISTSWEWHVLLSIFFLIKKRRGVGCEGKKGIFFVLGDFDEELMLVGADIYRDQLRWEFKTVIKALIS